VSIIVAPSLLAADPLNLHSEIIDIEKSGANWHHFDVMDGHFVPNLTFGPHVIKKLSKISNKILDVHLMVSNPEQVFEQYINAGADYLTFHVEAHSNPNKLIEEIKNKEVKVGLSLRPETPIEDILTFLPNIDLLLIMGVEPGFGGQKLIETTFERLNKARQFIDKNSLKTLISIDGGVNLKNYSKLIESGAHVLVAGSFIYGAKNRKEQISLLKNH
jgi:ribulose-phosphate 3-epimerase